MSLLNKPTICVDFDGVIAEDRGWQGVGVFGQPITGTIAALKYLKSLDWFIIIFTCRGEEGLVEGYCKKHGVPFHSINKNPHQPDGTNNGKPMADVYLDDRAVAFDGDWAEMMPKILRLGDK